MTTKTVLRAMSATELARLAIAQATAALTAPEPLQQSFFRAEVQAIEDERLVRGQCPISWFEQARRDASYWLGQQPKRKSKPRKPTLDVDLSTVPPAAIAQAAILLAKGSEMALAGDQHDGVGHIFAQLARALDAHVPSTPRRAGRGSPMAN